MKKKITLLALFTAMIVFFIPVKAQDKVTRVHRFDLAGIEELEINNAVGKIELILVEGDEIRLELEIEAQEEGFFRRRRDLDEVHLDI
jgi:DNA/RNA endonuclease YhcR with UshA esterase domain